ncbi:carbohydrate-binding protein [Pedobacter frigiditerrae]|uniref:Carbohydrate-binding protein n=1 Tax=Pedobacter frigiditerrae TaxID=2530452 RepID=A0A4R0N1K5_9SPHI|nr:family 43 glycosylhydrolase [Pedobacter frigiditerrae]TCC93651.1 carbohydrate-binding protein [Pedobacter frigiditerrae]
MLKHLVFCFGFITVFNSVSAQNPLINSQYTADPSARVFGDRVYIYPSHDIIATKEKGRLGWFAMEDYHVFSSANLIDWTDHGVIVTQNNVSWVKPNSYSMWAPDCIERNGKYYFYFPTTPKDTIAYGKGFTIGVAVSNRPEGPFIPESTPIKNVKGIDPNVFIDKDGQAYLYWSGGNIYGAKLKENMLELESEVKTLGDLPTKGLKEGPYMFERNGLYYLTYPHVENKIERLEYAIGKHPLGPFKVMGVIMDESATGCWTNHHSIIEFKKQWYLFYHHNDYSPNFDKARSIRADSLTFNADGTIKKVIPTLRGIGVIDAKKTIQLDRYSQISSKGVSIDFIDTADRFKGWKTVFTENNAWLQYNTVAFGNKSLHNVKLKAKSTKEVLIQIRIGKPDGLMIAEVKVPQSESFIEVNAPLLKRQTGIQNLFIVMKSNGHTELDWLTFE